MRFCILHCLISVFVSLWLHNSYAQTLPPQPPSQQVVLNVFKEQEPITSCELTTPRTLQIYIDGSGSMRGFVTDKEAIYTNALQQVLNRAIIAQYTLNIHKFSSTIVSLHTGLANNLISPKFYDGNDTSLAYLFNKIANNNNGLSVIISDLIQSEPGRDQISLLQALREVVTKRPEVLLLAFQSRFCQTGLKQNIEQERQRCNKRQDNYQERAFYLLVIAPCKEELMQFKNAVLLDLKEQELFWATHAALEVKNVELALPQTPHPNGPVWNRYQRPIFSLSPPISFETYNERRAPHSPDDALHLRLTVQPKMENILI